MMFRYNPNGEISHTYPEDNQTTFHQSSSVIKCTHDVPSLSGFAFINVTNLTILNITIYGCGAPVPFTEIDNINNLTASLMVMILSLKVFLSNQALAMVYWGLIFKVILISWTLHL